MSGLALNNNLLNNNKTPFKMEVSVIDSETFTIPQLSGYNYNYRVNWGDGNFARVTSYNDANVAHTYTSAGTYIIEILGLNEAVYFNNGGNKLNVTKILQWGTTDFIRINLSGCSNLSEIPTVTNSRELIKLESLYYAFLNCTNLTGTIPLFLSNSTKVTTMYRTFRFTNFDTIPEHLLDNLNVLTNCYGTFEDMVNITALPNGLFKNLNITDVTECFASDTNLADIPANTFEGCDNLTNMNSLGTLRGCFSNCNISTIPIGLLDDCINLQYCNFLFQDNPISEIPSNFFDNNINLLSVEGVFYNDTNITSIPVDLLKYNTLLTNVSYLFHHCGITSIPVDFFRYNIKIKNFDRTFAGNPLSSLPNNLFLYNTEALTFLSTFIDCINLYSLPSGLFKNLNKAYKFDETFQRSGLTSIPVDTFEGCSANNQTFGSSLTDSNRGTFGQCSDLTDIPAGLFDDCVNAIKFNGTFSGTGITSIPANLLDYNTALISVFAIFNGCTGITSIPANLFDYNTLVTNFRQTFDSCSGLTSIPANLITPALHPNLTSLYRTFYQCTGINTTVYEIWNLAWSGTLTNHAQCFYNDTNITNYADIPTDWK